MSDTINRYSYHSRGVFLCSAITCITFVLTEYCVGLKVLDELHLKHIFLVFNIFLFGIYLLKKKERLFEKEVCQIIICAISLYVISLFFQIKNGAFKVHALEEVYYLIAPLILIWIIFNFVSLRKIPTLVNLMFYASCFCFIIKFGKEISFLALSNISFIDSSSPFESDLAQFFLLFCIFYLYTKQYIKVGVSALLCFLCFKRFTLVMLIAMLIGFKFLPHRKKVPKLIYVITVTAFIVAPFVIYYLSTDTFDAWFYQKFGVDFDYFSMTRFSIINTVIDADLVNYGIGTVTQFLELRNVEGQLNMHNDILRIYMETTIVGSVIFTRQYFNTFKENIFSYVIVFYAFMELLVAHYLGPGTISFWLIAYTLIFYFNSFENVCSDEDRKALIENFGVKHKKIKFVCHRHLGNKSVLGEKYERE